MTATNDANLGLYLGWTYGEDNWNTGMDNNLVVLGATSQLYVKSKTTGTKPVSPANGDRYYIPVGATGDWSAYEKYLAVYSAFHAGWLYVPVKKGWEFRVEDDSNNSYYFDGTNLVSSVSLAGYLTASSTYTATGVVTFSNAPKFSGSHSIDTTELATMGDVDTKIAAIDYSTFVRTTGNQTVGGIKTFSSSPVIPDATNSNQAASKGQMDTAVSAVTGANVGTGANVFKDKSGSSIRLRSLVAGSNVTITEGADEITIAASGGGAVDETANYSWTGEHTWDISGGKSFIVSDDPTMVSSTSCVGFLDHVVGYNDTSVQYRTYWGTGTALFESYLSISDTEYGTVHTSLANTNGGYSDTTYLKIDGSSERDIYVSDLAIHADVILLNSKIRNLGYKTGTLASPPSGMVIGEVWADTTDSATHPIYRISTVTT